MSIMIVQFLHSGKEYKLSESEKEEKRKFWNCEKTHRRKFLHAKGIYIKKEDNSENEERIEVKENEKEKGNGIYFWGEWEPQSKVTPIENQEPGAFPHFIHEPFVEIKSGHLVVPINKEDKDAHPVNTDPFVFGEDGFYYSCCKQNRKYKDKNKNKILPTRLQKLEHGSIILFGSRIKEQNTGNPYFALDTVFVVGEDKLTYNINNDLSKLEEFAPTYYLDIMNYKNWGNNSNDSCNGNELVGCGGTAFTCYRGASYKNKENGMYSFVPCKIGEEGKKGFERVKLTDDSFKDIFKGIISNNLSQGVKYTETNLDVNIAIWKELCKIIENNGCKDRYYKAVELKYK